MAGRPRKTAVAEEKNTKLVAEIKADINEELMKQIKEMQEQLAKLKAENESFKNNKEEDDEEELTGDTEIMVISQTIGGLTISTEGNGIGTVYRFDKFGDIQDIPFSDLKDIVKNKPKFAKEGVYYISNEKAVSKLRLTNDYKNIISNDLFAHLLDEKPTVVVEAYKKAPRLQKEQIVGMIEEKLANKEEVDGNVLVKIGKLCGKDFLREDDEEE